MKASMRSILLGMVLLLAPVCAQDLKLATFDKVWQTIADKHWNPAQLEALPNGQKWSAIREPYRARVAAAANMAEVRTILREMIALIGKSHYAISGLDRPRAKLARDGGSARPGFSLAIVEGQPLVSIVQAGSPAATAGIETGWRLVSVDKTAFAPAYAEFEAQSQDLLHRPLRLHQFLADQINGYARDTLAYSFLDRKGQPRQVSLTLPQPDNSAGFGFVQGQTVEREFRLLGPKQDVAYFRLSLFMDVIRVLPQFEQAIKSAKNTRGFVIDLRGNPGGIAVMANALAGWFISGEGVKLGTMYQRGVEINFAVIPRLGGYSGPLAILVDGASASTAEIFAGGLQDLKRARVFGARTAGAALPSVVEQLPNGDLFQYAVANYVSQSGRELETAGVTPDVIVDHTRAALLAGRDHILDAALDWIYADPRP